MTDLVAFLDESRKPVRDRGSGRVSAQGEHYVVAAAVLIEGDLDAVRRRIRFMEADLGYRLHYSDLRSRERRRSALTALSAIPEWDAFVFETSRPLPLRNSSEHHIRSRIVSAAVLRLGVGLGVSRIVLETRGMPLRGFGQLDARDHQVLQSLRDRGEAPTLMRMSHADKSEPLLAIADLVAGARSDALCWTDLEAFPLVAHRVRAIEQVTTARGTQRPRDYEP